VGRVDVDWLLLGRYALLVSLCQVIPVPLVDAWTGNVLRRRLVRALAQQHGAELPEADVATLGDAPGGSCLGCALSVVLWPLKKILKTVFFVFLIKDVVDEVSRVLHHGLMLHDALERGRLPGDAAEVRGAMDRALDKIDTRVLERALRGVFRDARDDLNDLVHQATAIAREQVRGERVGALADAADHDALGPGVQHLSEAMAAALRGSGLVPEVLTRFRIELGDEVQGA
jgi:hypothetical protein